MFRVKSKSPIHQQKAKFPSGEIPTSSAAIWCAALLPSRLPPLTWEGNFGERLWKGKFNPHHVRAEQFFMSVWCCWFDLKQSFSALQVAMILSSTCSCNSASRFGIILWFHCRSSLPHAQQRSCVCVCVWTQPDAPLPTTSWGAWWERHRIGTLKRKEERGKGLAYSYLAI